MVSHEHFPGTKRDPTAKGETTFYLLFIPFPLLVGVPTMNPAGIMEVNEEIRKTKTRLNQVKESLRSKEDDLILYTDWKGLKETAGISNQKQRDSYIREHLRDDKSVCLDLEVKLEYLRRLFQILLLEKSQGYTNNNLLKVEGIIS